MKKSYSLFRSYCITCIIILCAVFLLAGFYTAEYRTGLTVFKASYPSVRIYSDSSAVTLNMGGRVFSFSPETLKKAAQGVRYVFLSPVNNIIEGAKAIGTLL